MWSSFLNTRMDFHIWLSLSYAFCSVFSSTSLHWSELINCSGCTNINFAAKTVKNIPILCGRSRSDVELRLRGNFHLDCWLFCIIITCTPCKATIISRVCNTMGFETIETRWSIKTRSILKRNMIDLLTKTNQEHSTWKIFQSS